MASHLVTDLQRAVYHRSARPGYEQAFTQPLVAHLGDDVTVHAPVPGSKKTARLTMQELYLPSGPYRRGRLHFRVGKLRHTDDVLRRRDEDRGGEWRIVPSYELGADNQVIITGMWWYFRKTRR